MQKAILLCLIFVGMFLSGHSQNDSVYTYSHDSIPNDSSLKRISLSNITPVYTLKPAIDIPIVAIGTTWSLYAFTKIYKKPSSTVAQIQNLKISDINAFDRWAVYPYSRSLDNISYYPFYAAIPYPLILFLTKKGMRNDFAKLGFLYWEAMSITGLLGTGATYNFDRYRPYAYSAETPMDIRTSGIAKNSFFAGHVQTVATPTFFLAKVYADYYPDSKIKWVFYGIASVATCTTAYMRLKSGEHFPSDILLGALTGSLAGILVPQYHKTNSIKDRSVTIMPYSTGDVNGVVITYKIK
jgi:membrane-associated phospholipid phosphatase